MYTYTINVALHSATHFRYEHLFRITDIATMKDAAYIVDRLAIAFPSPSAKIEITKWSRPSGAVIPYTPANT